MIITGYEKQIDKFGAPNKNNTIIRYKHIIAVVYDVLCWNYNNFMLYI